MLTVNVPLGKKVLLHSGAENFVGGSITDPFDTMFEQVGDDILNLWDSGLPKGQCFLAAKAVIGTTQVKISSASNGYSVNVIVNVVDGFDHFDPFADPPVAQ